MFRVSVSLLLFLAGILPAQPSISGVVNSASGNSILAPGGWMSIYGSRLAAGDAQANFVPLPKFLSGVSLTVGGIAAPLIFVSSAQINAILPFEAQVPSSGLLPLVVTTPEGRSSPFPVRITPAGPGIFTRNMTGAGLAHLFTADYRPADRVDPGIPLFFYAAGLGVTNPPASSDAGGAAVEPLNRIANEMTVRMGEIPARVDFAGLAPGIPGVYQVNVTPLGIPKSGRFAVKSQTWQSNVADIPVRPGGNVTNLAGGIEGVYPAGEGARIYQTVLPVVAQFTVKFEVAATARPFSLVAASEAGSMVIDFDPARGTFAAEATMPSAAARNGDLGDPELIPVLDLLTCQPSGGCQPFPASIIPASRLDPLAQRAFFLLPLPNAGTPGATQKYVSEGTIPADRRFVIDESTAAHLSRFGGFLKISPAGAKERKTPIDLWVDGVKVDSRMLVYRIP